MGYHAAMGSLKTSSRCARCTRFLFLLLHVSLCTIPVPVYSCCFFAQIELARALELYLTPGDGFSGLVGEWANKGFWEHRPTQPTWPRLPYTPASRSLASLLPPHSELGDDRFRALPEINVVENKGWSLQGFYRGRGGVLKLKPGYAASTPESTLRIRVDTTFNNESTGLVSLDGKGSAHSCDLHTANVLMNALPS